MARLWIKAVLAYVIGLTIAFAGLTVLGVTWPSLNTQIGLTLVAWLGPVASNPYVWLLLILFVLLWIGGPSFVERIGRAWEAASVDIQETPVKPPLTSMDTTYRPSTSHFTQARSIADAPVTDEDIPLMADIPAMDYRDSFAAGRRPDLDLDGSI
jgi:hypothetical protein